MLRPQAVAALQGCDRVVHAGDVGAAEVLRELARIAPVTTVRGNNDCAEWAHDLRETEELCIGSVRIFVIHDRARLAFDPAGAGYHVVVCGHSHRPGWESRNGVLYINPGSAGPRRFKLPVTVARLSVEDGTIRPELVELALR
jgi:putative phosphoesterase